MSNKQTDKQTNSKTKSVKCCCSWEADNCSSGLNVGV